MKFQLEKEKVVKMIALLDSILASSSFCYILAIIILQGNDASTSIMSLNIITHDNKNNKGQNNLQQEKAKSDLFRWVFWGIVITFSFLIHSVQIGMALMLYKGASKMSKEGEKEKGDAVKIFMRWRAWSIILLVFLTMGTIPFFFLFFVHSPAIRFFSICFLSLQILFQIAAIVYVGSCTEKVQEESPIQNIEPMPNLKILYEL